MRAIGVSHTACKDEFRRNLRSHSWSVFAFFVIKFTARVGTRGTDSIWYLISSKPNIVLFQVPSVPKRFGGFQGIPIEVGEFAEPGLRSARHDNSSKWFYDTAYHGCGVLRLYQVLLYHCCCTGYEGRERRWHHRIVSACVPRNDS